MTGRWASPDLRRKQKARARSCRAALCKGLEERRERPHDPKHDKDAGRDQDRPERPVLPPPEEMQHSPRAKEGDNRKDRLARKWADVIAPRESVGHARARLAEGREQSEGEDADPGSKHSGSYWP